MQQTAQRDQIGVTDVQYAACKIAALQDCSIASLQHCKLAALQPATLHPATLKHCSIRDCSTATSTATAQWSRPELPERPRLAFPLVKRSSEFGWCTKHQPLRSNSATT